MMCNFTTLAYSEMMSSCFQDELETSALIEKKILEFYILYEIILPLVGVFIGFIIALIFN